MRQQAGECGANAPSYSPGSCGSVGLRLLRPLNKYGASVTLVKELPFRGSLTTRRTRARRSSVCGFVHRATKNTCLIANYVVGFPSTVRAG